MATFTTSGSITAKILGYEFSGTGPFVCANEHLAEVKAQLEAAGETVSANKITEAFFIPSNAAGNVAYPLFCKAAPIVLTGGALIAVSDCVSGSVSYNTYSVIPYGTAGTSAAYSTALTYVGSAGTLVGGVKTAMTLSTATYLGSVPANYPVFLTKSTASSGTLTPNMSLILEYTY
jgi:hypothetical protein